ncbi:glycosyltransferase [Candidatus Daviesbacteria bacterium]|nr:glycosyltransferase [Candidatus Daviesbacteria bacterium]
MKSISIVIPNWNGASKLRRHLPKVIEAAQAGGAAEIIVVDDASADDSRQIITSEFPQVKFIEKIKNSGFSSTVNLGVKEAKGKLVALLNNDASPDRSFLQAALIHFQNEKIFSVSCNVGGNWTTAKFENGYFWHQQATGGVDRTKPHKTLWSSGGSGIFRKDIWQELEGLDELFDPFYEEDTDLGYRAIKRGYLNMWEPLSLVEHYKEEGVIASNFSQQTIERIAQRNQLFFIWKNITDKELMSEHEKALISRLSRYPKYWLVFTSALVKLPEVLKKRKKEKQKSRLTDREILEMFAS